MQRYRGWPNSTYTHCLQTWIPRHHSLEQQVAVVVMPPSEVVVVVMPPSEVVVVMTMARIPA